MQPHFCVTVWLLWKWKYDVFCTNKSQPSIVPSLFAMNRNWLERQRKRGERDGLRWNTLYTHSFKTTHTKKYANSATYHCFSIILFVFFFVFLISDKCKGGKERLDVTFSKSSLMNYDLIKTCRITCIQYPKLNKKNMWNEIKLIWWYFQIEIESVGLFCKSVDSFIS